MGQYEVTMICSPTKEITNLDGVKKMMETLSLNELLTLKKDIVELINKKVDATI